MIKLDKKQSIMGSKIISLANGAQKAGCYYTEGGARSQSLPLYENQTKWNNVLSLSSESLTFLQKDLWC